MDNFKDDAKDNKLIFKVNCEAITIIGDFIKNENKEITEFSMFFALLHIHLFSFTKTNDPIIGVMTPGKFQEEFIDVIGTFEKTLPIHFKMDSSKSFMEFTHQINEYLKKAESNHIYDFSNIIEEVTNVKDIKIEDLISAILIVQKDSVLDVNENDVYFSNYLDCKLNSNYPISLMVSGNDQINSFEFKYASQYFDRATAQLMTNNFITLIERISVNPHLYINELLNFNQEVILS